MNKVISLLLVVVFTRTGAAQGPASDPALAVVRIKSHGASGTVIATAPGKSWILSCCHMFFGGGDQIDQKLLFKKIVMDGPSQPQALQKLTQARVIAADPRSDLSLIEIDNGPFHYIPVAPEGFKPGKRTSSAGYDLMRWPLTHHHASIVSQLSDWTYTRERPVEGRSGGGLFDLDARVLIGVCNGYEVTGQGRGIYIAHQAVLRFLAKRERPKPAPPAAKLCPT